MKSIRCLSILLLVLALLFSSGTAYADGDMYYTCQFTYKIRSGTSDQVRADWQNAAADWTNVHSGISIVSSSSSTNELYSLYDSATADHGQYIAYDYLTIGPNNNRFTRFDAWINRAFARQTYCWRSTACHELGHVLGLCHTPGISIMNGNRNREVIYSPQLVDISNVISVRNL